MMKRTKKSNSKRRRFDKYDYYTRAVQSPDTDVEFIRKTYYQLKRKMPSIFREDFCGTFAISCEWIKLSQRNQAISVDIDSEPLQYGKTNLLTKLDPKQQGRIKILNTSVLSPKLPKADIIAAFNFSYYLFKERETLLRYFMNCRKTLRSGGILVVDAFGGALCQKSNLEKNRFSDFTYEWEQMYFNAITNEALFHIHFKLRKEKTKRRRVFSYDWRMWSIPEIREIMREAGFRKTHVYWETSDAAGEGTGHYIRSEKGDECDAWVAYLVGEK
ncbi:MAG: class I SAM-dependent methyltransferase [Bdellovibrionales bacterium]